MSAPRLEKALRALEARFPPARRLPFDPVRFPRAYARREDREVVALLAALLAYGRVGSILAKVEAVLSPLGRRPAQAVRSLRPRRSFDLLAGWRHRWTDARDVAYLLEGIRRILEEEGSLERAFKAGWSPDHPDLRPALGRFHARLRSVDPEPVYGRPGRPRSLSFFLADPSKDSPLKRWSLFLRWVVRPDDGVDLGAWSGIPTDRLTVPLDTHVHRIAFALGLTRSRTSRWETAREVTRSLARVDPRDPVRFDFALSHLGISGACRGYRVARICGGCPLRGICALPERPFAAGRAA